MSLYTDVFFKLFMKSVANQSSMSLALVRCSIEANQGGRDTVCQASARVSLVSWEGGSHVVLFMVLLSPWV